MLLFQANQTWTSPYWFYTQLWVKQGATQCCQAFKIFFFVAANGESEAENLSENNPSYESYSDVEARQKRQAQNETELETTPQPVAATTAAADEDSDHMRKASFGSYLYLCMTIMSTIGKRVSGIHLLTLWAGIIEKDKRHSPWNLHVQVPHVFVEKVFPS